MSQSASMVLSMAAWLLAIFGLALTIRFLYLYRAKKLSEDAIKEALRRSKGKASLSSLLKQTNIPASKLTNLLKGMKSCGVITVTQEGEEVLIELNE